MRVRLAFAVAAHLEPEILIVDEVLAVGDAEFQRKCLSKMEDVGKEGRTVLFVSHNMPAVTRLCKSGILLNQGEVEKTGNIHDVVSAYLSTGTSSTSSREWPDDESAPSGNVSRLRAVRAINREGDVADTVNITDPVGIEMEYDVLDSDHVLLPHFRLRNSDGLMLFETLDLDPQWRNKKRPAGKYKSTVWIPGNFFADGEIYVDCHMMTLHPNELQFAEQQTILFYVVENDSPDLARGDYTGRLQGLIRPKFEWQTQTLG